MPHSTVHPHSCITWHARSIMSFNACLIAHGKWGKLRADKNSTVLCWKLRHKDKLSPTSFSIHKSSFQYCCETIHTELSKMAFYSLFLGSLQKSECTDFLKLQSDSKYFKRHVKTRTIKVFPSLKNTWFSATVHLFFLYFKSAWEHICMVLPDKWPFLYSNWNVVLGDGEVNQWFD